MTLLRTTRVLPATGNSWQEAALHSVTNLEGHRISFGRASGSLFATMLPMFGTGACMIFFTPRRQALARSHCRLHRGPNGQSLTVPQLPTSMVDPLKLGGIRHEGNNKDISSIA